MKNIPLSSPATILCANMAFYFHNELCECQNENHQYKLSIVVNLDGFNFYLFFWGGNDDERFIKLFEDAMENHAGVVAMGLLASSGVIQSVPLCEIEAYNRMDGFGIFVTIRAVGRAALLGLNQEEPYMKGVCVEKVDTLPPNLELPNVVASSIENMMVTLSSMEYQLEQKSLIMDDDTNTISPSMKLRMMEAELVRYIPSNIF